MRHGLYEVIVIVVIFREMSNPPPPGASSVSGKVTNANAEPDNTVAGIHMKIELKSDPTVTYQTATLEDGSYSFASIPNGVYKLTADMADADGSVLHGETEITVAGVPLTVPDLALVRRKPPSHPKNSFTIKAAESP